MRQNPVVRGDAAPDVRIAPVEVRLPGQEGLVIVLARHAVAGLGRAAETGDPIVRRSAIRGRIAPDVPVALWTGPRRAA